MIFTRRADACVLHLRGAISSDADKAQLSEKLATLARDETNVTIDLSRLSYATSQVLGLFMITHKTLAQKRGTFTLLAPVDGVRDLLRITGMDRVFVIRNEIPK